MHVFEDQKYEKIGQEGVQIIGPEYFGILSFIIMLVNGDSAMNTSFIQAVDTFSE